MPKKEEKDKDKKKHSSKEKKSSSKDKDKEKDKKKHSSKDKEKHASKHSSKEKSEKSDTKENVQAENVANPSAALQPPTIPPPSTTTNSTNLPNNPKSTDSEFDVTVPSQTNFPLPTDPGIKETIPGFQENFSKVNDAINIHLIPKRQRIIEMMQKLRSKLDEIQAIKQGIIKEIKIEANKYILDMDLQTKNKVGDLKSDFMELRSFYEEIEGFISRIGNSIANVESQTFFMNNFQNGNITNQMKNLMLKPFKDVILVKTDDIVNRFDELKRSKDEIFELKRMILMKDSIISSLLKQRGIMEQQNEAKVGELTELYNSATKELRNWVDVFEKKKFNQAHFE